MGHSSLIPVETIDDSREIDILNVVVKKTKRKFLFWKKAIYDPHKIPLEQLLVSHNSPLALEQSLSHFVNYNRESSFSLSGKVGVSLMKELMDVNLTASDTVTIKANLGDIIKTTVNKVKLLDSLRERQIDIKHNFLNELREDSSLSLCVVATVFTLGKDADISRKIAKGVEAGAKAKVSESTSVEASGKVESDKQKQFGLYKGTVVAYKVAELNIDVTTGSIEPVLFRERFGGFFTRRRSIKDSSKDKSDAEDSTCEDPHPLQYIQDTLKPILDLSSPTRDKLKSVLLELMSSHTDIELMVELLEEEKALTRELSTLEEKFVIPKDKWQLLLEMTGLRFNEEGLPSRSEELNLLKTSVLHVLDCMLELNEIQLELLKFCEEGASKALLTLCQLVMKGQPMIELDESTQPIKSDQFGMKLAEELGLTFVETNITIIKSSKEPSAVFEQILWILYAMYE